MSFNLLESVQNNLGYPALQKIDPNTQNVLPDEKKSIGDKFSQAAIPAVLTGLFNFVQSDIGAEAFLKADLTKNWVGVIFNDHKNTVLQTIAAYAGQLGESIAVKLNAIANEATKLVKEHLPADAGIKEVKLYFSNQKNNILLYLPGDLKLGELLHDNTLDDTTNKMEGPISSLMQSIGAAFSKPVTGDDIKSHEDSL